MADKTIIRHPIHTFQTYIARECALPPPERVGTLGYRLATNSFRTEEEGLRSRYIYILPASPRRACGKRQTVGFAERFAAPQRPSAFRVLGPMRSMTKGALRPDKELAYGEQKDGLSAEGHIEYLHTKFHRRTTSNKKVRKTGFAPISRQK